MIELFLPVAFAASPTLVKSVSLGKVGIPHHTGPGR
jgi:hypothetical protein